MGFKSAFKGLKLLLPHYPGLTKTLKLRVWSAALLAEIRKGHIQTVQQEIHSMSQLAA